MAVFFKSNLKSHVCNNDTNAIDKTLAHIAAIKDEQKKKAWLDYYSSSGFIMEYASRNSSDENNLKLLNAGFKSDILAVVRKLIEGNHRRSFATWLKLHCANDELIKHALTAIILEKSDHLMSVMFDSVTLSPDALKHGMKTAMAYDRTTCAILLMNKDAPLNIVSSTNQSLLHRLAIHGDIVAAEKFIEKAPELINMQDEMGETALHLALENKFLEFARFLVQKGAQTNIKNQRGYTAEDFSRTNKLPLTQTEQDGTAQEQWQKLSDDSLSYVAPYPALNKKLTHIFNFAHETCYVTTETLDGSAPPAAAPPVAFTDLSDNLRDRAIAAFKHQGGFYNPQSLVKPLKLSNTISRQHG